MWRQRHFAPILKLLYPEYSPRKRLQSVPLVLKYAPDDEKEARNLVWKTGEEINRVDVEWI